MRNRRYFHAKLTTLPVFYRQLFFKYESRNKKACSELVCLRDIAPLDPHFPGVRIDVSKVRDV